MTPRPEPGRRALLVVALLAAGGVGWLARREPATTDADKSLQATVADRTARAAERGGPHGPPAPLTGPRAARAGVDPHAVSALVVRVHDEAGMPLSDARVLAVGPSDASLDPFAWPGPRALVSGFELGGGPEERRTDATGRARFEDLDPATRALVALVRERPPARAVLSTTTGEVAIEVPDGTRVAGRVRIDGAPPAGELALELAGFADPCVGWSEAAREAVRAAGVEPERLRAATSSEGTFAFLGLPPGGYARLDAPRTFLRLDGGPARLTVAVGAEDVVLDLVTRPTLRVRAVAREHAADAPEQVRLEVKFESSTAASRVERVETRPGETHAFPVIEPDLDSVELVAFGPDGKVVGREHRAVATLDLDATLEVVVPAPPARLVLRVTDLDGQPLPGARALAGGARAGPAGADGVLELEVSTAARELLVGAPRHAAVARRLVPPFDGREEVRLAPANRVEIFVHGATAFRAAGVGVDVIVPGDGPPHPGERLRGPPPATLAPDGRWTAWDLPPSRTVRLALRDPHAHTLTAEEIVLAPGEHRLLTWTVEAWPQVAVGRIVDADGTPIPGAAAHYGRFLGWPHETDGDGWFEIRDVFEPDPRVSIGAPGRVSRELRAPAVFQGLEHVLEAARSLEVEARSPGGPASIRGLRFELADGTFHRARPIGPGRYRIDGAPRRAGVLRGDAPYVRLEVSATANQVAVDLRP